MLHFYHHQIVTWCCSQMHPADWAWAFDCIKPESFMSGHQASMSINLQPVRVLVLAPSLAGVSSSTSQASRTAVRPRPPPGTSSSELRRFAAAPALPQSRSPSGERQPRRTPLEPARGAIERGQAAAAVGVEWRIAGAEGPGEAESLIANYTSGTSLAGQSSARSPAMERRTSAITPLP